MSGNDNELKLFWEWKRRDLLLQLTRNKYKSWHEFESHWVTVKDKNNERPEKGTYLFTDYIHWKTKNKPVITDVLPDYKYVKDYFDKELHHTPRKISNADLFR